MHFQSRRSRWFCVLALGIVGVLLAGACTEDQEARTTADDIKSELEQEGGVDNSDDGERIAGKQLSLGELLAAARDMEVDIRYRVTTADEAEASVQEITFAQDPPRKAVRTGDTTIIIPGDGGVIFCSQDEKCTKLSGLGDLASGLISGVLGAFFAATDLESDIEQAPDFARTDDRKIAGLQATCFSYRQTGSFSGDSKVSQCVDSKTGITLSFKTSNEADTSEVVAEKVGKPDAEDFNPPSAPA